MSVRRATSGEDVDGSDGVGGRRARCRRLDDEHIHRAEHVDREQHDLGDDALQRRPVSGDLRREDGHARPVVEAVIGDEITGLQRVDGVTEECHRRQHDARDGDGHEPLDRARGGRGGTSTRRDHRQGDEPANSPASTHSPRPAPNDHSAW